MHSTKLRKSLLLAVSGTCVFAASVSAQQIFWANTGGFGNPGGGSIWTLDLGSGAGAQQLVGGLHRPIGLAVHGGNLYWAEDGHDAATSRIGRSTLTGGDVSTVFSGVANSFENAQKLVIHPSTGQIYWTDYFQGVLTGHVSGSGYQVLGGGASQYTSIDLHLGAGHIYYGDPTNNGMLRRMTLAGTGDEAVAGPLTTGNWEFNSHVLDQATGDIFYSNTATHSIHRLGDASPFATDLTAPFGVAIHDGFIYWVGGGNLGRVGLDGAGAAILASGIDGTAFGLTVIPEPSSYALLFASMAGLLILVRRKMRK
jgi:hypothetical protein